LTDLNDILTDLRSEIVEHVLQVAVREKGSGETSFEYHLPSKGEMTPGRPRLFSVTGPAVESKWCGHGLQRYDTEWAIRVGYPAHDWDIAIASDFDQLRGSFNSNGAWSSTTGCAFHHMPLTNPPREPQGTDWQWVSYPVRAVVETTTAAKELPNYQTTTDVSVTVAGSPVTVYSFTPTSDGSASWSYHVQSSDGKTSRGGLLAAAWDIVAASAAHWDESTSDVVATGATYANTTGLVFNVSVSGTTVSLTATSTDDTWAVRTTELSRNEA